MNRAVGMLIALPFVIVGAVVYLLMGLVQEIIRAYRTRRYDSTFVPVEHKRDSRGRFVG